MPNVHKLKPISIRPDTESREAIDSLRREDESRHAFILTAIKREIKRRQTFGEDYSR